MEIVERVGLSDVANLTQSSAVGVGVTGGRASQIAVGGNEHCIV
jgi:hypothetical protein